MLNERDTKSNFEYTICPNALLNDSRLDSACVHVWLTMARHDNIKDWNHSTQYIASQTGMHKNTVLKKISKLCEYGYVIKTQRKSGFKNSFDYHIPTVTSNGIRLKLGHNNYYSTDSSEIVNTNIVTTPDNKDVLNEDSSECLNVTKHTNIVTTPSPDMSSLDAVLSTENQAFEDVAQNVDTKMLITKKNVAQSVDTNLVITKIVANNNNNNNKTDLSSFRSIGEGEDVLYSEGKNALEIETFSLASSKENLDGNNISGEGSNSASEMTKDLPEWFVKDGVYDKNFIHWLTLDFQESYGHSYSKARRNVFSCFANSPEKVNIYWDSFKQEYLKKLYSAKRLSDNLLSEDKKINEFLVANSRLLSFLLMEYPKEDLMPLYESKTKRLENVSISALPQKKDIKSGKSISPSELSKIALKAIRKK